MFYKSCLCDFVVTVYYVYDRGVYNVCSEFTYQFHEEISKHEAEQLGFYESC